MHLRIGFYQPVVRNLLTGRHGKFHMKKLIISALLILLVLPCIAQTSGKNDELKFDADYFLMRKEFGKALDIYLHVLHSEPENADILYRIGICYLNSENEKNKAIPYLYDASKNVSTRYNTNSFKEFHSPVEVFFLLGSAYRVNDQLDEAIGAYEKYKEFLDPKDKYNREVTDQYIQHCRVAKELIKKPQNVTFTNLGKVINNDLANYNPVISGDGKILAFTAPGKQGYDIYISSFNDSAWSVPKNISPALGGGKYMKTSSLSFDGNTLLLDLEDPENSDLYLSHFKKGRWSKVEPLSKEINSKWNETNGSFSADGKTLYFTSNRKGGEGDLDIYRSMLQGDVWSAPQNLGSGVNTPYNEETPFVTQDNKELYFSSEGHEGMGGYDVFRYDLSNPDKDVKNVGYPVNTTDNNLFYVPYGDGSTAYYAFRGPDSYGGRDIYRVTVIPEVVEEEVVAAVDISPIENEADPAEIVPESAPRAELAVPEPIPAFPLTVAMADKHQVVPENPEMIETVVAETAVMEPKAIAEEPGTKEVFVEPGATAVKETPEKPEEMSGRARSYTVQFMALKNPVDIQYFKELSDISITLGHDEWYRYTLMTTTDSLRADKIKSDLVHKGFSDAFIRRKSIIPRFTIQVMAVPGPVTDLEVFDNLPEISVRKDRDKFCRYTTGWFESKDDARNALAEIRSLGYTSAFVRKVKTLQ